MRTGAIGGFWAVLAWMTLPVVPVVLEDLYCNIIPIPFDPMGRPDPRDWNWEAWLVQLGPLLGFGFLAGATIGLPEAPTNRRGPRSWLSRRGFWVVVGPWLGFLVWVALFWGFVTSAKWITPLLPDRKPTPGQTSLLGPGWENSLPGMVFVWVVFAFVVSTLCYGWLAFAVAAVRRARRIGRGGPTFRRGLAVAATFLGSLFGSFWAVTEWWRTYFFDPRVVPVLLAALSLVAVSGCGGPITYGEVRRRELFHAMLLAWTFGLALLWRWWARPRT